jgi:peroxiredoxin family protein
MDWLAGDGNRICKVVKLYTCREKVEMMDLKPEDLIDMIKEA